MKISKKQFLDNIVGFEVLKGNKYALYYDPFKNKKKGGAIAKKWTLRGQAAPYIVSFIGGITLKLLYDATMLLNKAINEKDKTKTNYKIFKDYVKEEYGTASNAFRNLIVIPGIAGAVGGLSYDKIEEKYKDNKLIWPYISGLKRIIAGVKKPGPPLGSKHKPKVASSQTVKVPLETAMAPLEAMESLEDDEVTVESPLSDAYFYDYSQSRSVSPEKRKELIEASKRLRGRPTGAKNKTNEQKSLEGAILLATRNVRVATRSANAQRKAAEEARVKAEKSKSKSRSNNLKSAAEEANIRALQAEANVNNAQNILIKAEEALNQYKTKNK